MVKSQARRFVPTSYRDKLAQAFINVSWTRSSARSGCPDNDMANARNEGIAASNSSFSELLASVNSCLLGRRSSTSSSLDPAVRAKEEIFPGSVGAILHRKPPQGDDRS